VSARSLYAGMVHRLQGLRRAIGTKLDALVASSVGGRVAAVAALLTIVTSGMTLYTCANHHFQRSPGTTAVEVVGSVTDPARHPLQGAVVRLEDGSAETVSGRDGGFTLRLPARRRGERIHLLAEHPGFAPGELDHTVGDEVAWIVLRPPEDTGPGGVVICDWDAQFEEIVLCNQGPAVDLGGWRLSDGEGSHLFPAGTRLESGARRTFSADDYNPRRKTTDLLLNNDHDQIRLVDADGAIADEVEW